MHGFDRFDRVYDRFDGVYYGTAECNGWQAKGQPIVHCDMQL